MTTEGQPTPTSKTVEAMEDVLKVLTTLPDKEVAGAAARAIERLMRLRVKLILREAKS